MRARTIVVTLLVAAALTVFASIAVSLAAFLSEIVGNQDAVVRRALYMNLLEEAGVYAPRFAALIFPATAFFTWRLSKRSIARGRP